MHMHSVPRTCYNFVLIHYTKYYVLNCKMADRSFEDSVVFAPSALESTHLTLIKKHSVQAVAMLFRSILARDKG